MGRNSDAEAHKEYIDLMKFIVEKSKNVEGALNIEQMIREFIEFSGSPRPARSFKNRFYHNRMRIHELNDFDFETKVRILVATSASVDLNFLKELEKQATVEVDEENRILNYIANDGKLKLKRDLSRSTKRKSKIREELSSNEFKGEDAEFDVEYVYEDVEGENLVDNNNESIVRSGRVSKKRFANFDFSNNGDHNEHESSTRKKTKKQANSIDSTPTTPSVNIPSSSARSTPRIQRTEPNEVIYDGPGEPSLPAPLNMKRETIQYPIHPEYRLENKPIPFDLYNMQLQEQHIERLIDDDVDFENTQISNNNQINEEVSSDEFLKLLRSLVKTLGSEMLAELEKDIQTEMETFKNQNRKIQIKDIEEALRAAISLVIKAAKPKEASSENTESLRGFLMLINMIAFNNSALTVIQQEIQESIKGLGVEDKIIHIKSIRTALETVFLMVTSS